jgi:hypothetical protein
MHDADISGELAFFDLDTKTWRSLSESCFKLLNDTQSIDDKALDEIKESKQHVQNILSSALKLPNVTFFSGSGASLGEVGGPSMSDLWKRSMWVDPDAQPDEEDYGVLHQEADYVLNQVNYQNIKNPNIEHFLSQCEAYLQFNDDSRVVDYVRDVKETIVDECTYFLDEESSDISPYQTLLQKLARRRVRDPRLNVFTTNYDICYETAASNLGMMIVDGFSYSRLRQFNGKYFDYDVVKRDDDNHEFVEGVFKLFKLHGSVSWKRVGETIVESKDVKPDDVALIYPAQGKYQQAFIQPYLELLSRFLQSLREPNNCLIISGFGFNDNHLSEPILSAIKSNPSLKLVIADYSAHQHIFNDGNNGSSVYWKSLYELALHGYDIHFINASFSQLVSLVPNLKAISPAEQLVSALKKTTSGAP